MSRTTTGCPHCYSKHSTSYTHLIHLFFFLHVQLLTGSEYFSMLLSDVVISLVGRILASLALISAELISATEITPLVSIYPFLCFITYRF
jgi:hypothetical protein